ncbi:MAG TPA: substrate-binding domain-containing protein, partial [Lachnospiraceae bacterium]
FVKMGSYHAKYGYELFKELYTEGNMPTALFVANDSMVTGAYRAAYELGLKIPEDISIVGFNDLPAAKYMIPPLTTMKLPMEFMGEYAVSLLEDRALNGREISLKVIVPTRLCVRDSVKNLRG